MTEEFVALFNYSTTHVIIWEHFVKITCKTVYTEIFCCKTYVFSQSYLKLENICISIFGKVWVKESFCFSAPYMYKIRLKPYMMLVLKFLKTLEPIKSKVCSLFKIFSSEVARIFSIYILKIGWISRSFSSIRHQN